MSAVILAEKGCSTSAVLRGPLSDTSRIWYQNVELISVRRVMVAVGWGPKPPRPLEPMTAVKDLGLLRITLRAGHIDCLLRGLGLHFQILVQLIKNFQILSLARYCAKYLGWETNLSMRVTAW